ncbi:MAG: hypothetical protein ABW217_13205 [Polyangiaceae bacterium]
MVKRERTLLGCVALLALSACEPGLSLEAALAGRPCRATAPYCLPGFSCSASNVCVPSSEREGSGAGGSAPGAGGSSAAPIGAGGTGSGAVAVGQGGAGGASPLEGEPRDAGGEPAPSDAAIPVESDGCVPGPLYQDLDGDGFGGLAVQAFGCSRDGLVSTPGDCADDPAQSGVAAEVHPGQLEFFFVGYRDTSKPGDISFDYDCSGSEERQPQSAGAAPDCEALDGSECTGSGYVPDIARQGVAGVDALCGSEVVAICTPGGQGQCNSVFSATEQLCLCR